MPTTTPCPTNTYLPPAPCSTLQPGARLYSAEEAAAVKKAVGVAQHDRIEQASLLPSIGMLGMFAFIAGVGASVHKLMNMRRSHRDLRPVDPTESEEALLDDIDMRPLE